MALRITVDAPDVPVVRTCKYGHALTPDNLSWDVSSKDHVRRPRCRICKRASVQKSRGAIGRTDAPPSMIMPRLTTAGRPLKTTTYETRPLLGLLPKDMRDSIAGAILSSEVDPLVRRVLKRCTDRPAWAGTPENVAARMFVERCLDQVIDARSPLLRIDRLLRVALG